MKTKLELQKVIRPLADDELKGVNLYRVRARFRVPAREAIEGEIITLPDGVAAEHMEHLEQINVHTKHAVRFEHVEVSDN